MSKNKPAFTLLELVITMVLITILTVTGVFISFRSNKLIAAASKLMFDLRYAQQMAISRQVPCGISFNISSNSYFVFTNNTSTKANDPYTGENFDISYNSGELKGISLTNTTFSNIIKFNYLGIPSYNNGTALTRQENITLQQGSYTKKVSIEPNSGQVKLP